MTKTEENKKVLLDALERSLGIVTTACRSVKLSRTQFYEWMDNDSKFAAKFKDIKEMQKDFVESEIYGSTWVELQKIGDTLKDKR